MGFRVNTDILALNANRKGDFNQKSLITSLERLSTGLRINKSADDASGLMIADILRSQANTLGQSIKNANDGIAIVQTADKAINEQSKILDTIKTKATQSAQDSQTLETRKMIQKDIEKLILELDNIASTTSFNGQALLAGQYINKKFQIGANSNETISVDINATNSEKIGHVRFETGAMIRESSIVEDLKFKNIDGMQDLTIENIIISHTAGTGIGVLAEAINKNSDKTGVKASWTNKYTTVNPLGNTNYESLELNGISIGAVENIKDNDSDGKLVNAINEHTDKTGIIASIDTRGHVEYKSIDGRGMSIKVGLAGNVFSYHYYGRLTLTKLDATNIDISATSLDSIGFNKSYIRDTTNLVEATVNLGDIKRGFTITQAEAMGMFTTDHTALYSQATQAKLNIQTNISENTPAVGVGVTTLTGAMAVMDIAQSSIKHLDSIRSNIGSTQNQMLATINNISVTRINLLASQSQIRDVDFAKESANFSKYNILTQAREFVLSRTIILSQDSLKLLSLNQE